jgi:hypothetical protein
LAPSDRKKRVTIKGVQMRSAEGESHYTGGFASDESVAINFFPKAFDISNKLKIGDQIIMRQFDLQEK